MSKTKRAIRALGVALALTAGCTSADTLNFLFLQSSPKNGERVIAASVDSVAQSLQATLGQRGMDVTVNKKGDNVYVSSQTKNGIKFAFVLAREKTKDGEQTRLHIEWENGKDEEMGLQILAQLVLPTK